MHSKIIGVIMLGMFCTYTQLLPQAQAQQVQTEMLNKEEIDEESLKRAEALSDQLLSNMARGEFYEITEDDAIPQIVQSFTKDFQQQAYQQISAIAGDYESALDFQEAHKFSQGGMEGVIYRFKGAFSKSVQEVRAVMLSDHTLAGFRVLPWNDQM